jgi:hypothetical protein
VKDAFGFLATQKPRLAVWLLPFTEGDPNGVLPALKKGFQKARRRYHKTRHGVFHWSPERCGRIPPSDIEDAYSNVDFVFQFGYQDERLAAKDPKKYLPWPLGTADFRSWTTPARSSLVPTSQRDNLAAYRGSKQTHGESFDQLNTLGRLPGVVIESRDKWTAHDDEEDATRYKTLLASSKYALAPAGHNPNCYRVQEAVESGAIPVIVPGTSDHNACYDNWSGLYGLPVKGATAYPWIPAAPFRTLHSFGEFGRDLDAVRKGATDKAGRKLQSWYDGWRAAFHDRLELLVQSSMSSAPAKVAKPHKASEAQDNASEAQDESEAQDNASEAQHDLLED